jgi:hypothetical protein
LPIPNPLYYAPQYTSPRALLCKLDGEYSGEHEQKKACMHGISRAAPARARKGRPKYIFTKADEKIVKLASKQYGTSYSNIAKEYFSTKTLSVSAKEIQNFVNGIEDLKVFVHRDTDVL